MESLRISQMRNVQKGSSLSSNAGWRLLRQLCNVCSIGLVLTLPEEVPPLLQVPLEELVLREVLQFPLADRVELTLSAANVRQVLLAKGPAKLRDELCHLLTGQLLCPQHLFSG